MLGCVVFVLPVYFIGCGGGGILWLDVLPAVF